jgi:hypothetical protein
MRNVLARGSSERPGHGGGGHSGVADVAEGDDGVWPTQAGRVGAGWLSRCAKSWQRWLREQLGAGGAKVEESAAERELDGGAGRRERRRLRSVGRGIDKGEASGCPAPDWGLATEAAACLHARRRCETAAAAAASRQSALAMLL